MCHLAARRLLAAALVAAATMLSPIAADAGGRHSAMIIDANTGDVLVDQSGDELRHPASLTKMMTLYMAFELIEMGRLSYATPIKVTAEAAAAAPSKLELEPGETIRLIDAIKALVTKSANDMAIAIAQHIAGSEQNFARLMTEKARQLGMSHTVFRNASGLPNDEQVTTARDMITLGLHLQDDFPEHYKLFSLRTFAYNGGSYRNHNTLLISYRGTDGIKTGYTRKSGFNLVANVRRDGKHLIGAIFGGETGASRNAKLRALLDRALPRASTRRTRKTPLSALVVAQREQAAKSKPARVARAEPPPQPKPAVRRSPAPAPVAAEPAPPAAAPKQAMPAEAAPPPSPAVAAAEKAIAEATIAAAQVPPPSSTGTNVATPQLAVASGGPTISVARVRRVMVAPHVTRPPVAVADPRAAAPAAPASAGERTASPAPFATAAASPSSPGLAPTAAPTAATPPQAHETVLAKTPAPADAQIGREPSSFAAQVSALAANVGPMAAARAPEAAPPAPQAPSLQPVSAPASPQLGAPPSTLDAQADAIGALARGEPLPREQPQQVAAVAPPTFRLNGPQGSARPSAAPAPSARPAHHAVAGRAGGAFQIQIGAFSTPAEAERQLTNAQGTLGAVLVGHAPLTIPVAKSNRTLYRARFAAFDANSAAAACLELRRQQVDCFVMKAE